MNPKIPVKFGGRAAPHVFLILGSAAATLVIFALTPDFFNEIVSHALANPQVVLLEFLFALVAVYFFYFITGRVWLGVGIPALLIYILCMINKYKVYLRGDPFMPADIILGGEVRNILSASSLSVGLGSIALLALIVAGIAALAMLFRFKKAGGLARFTGSLACAACAVALFFGVYTNTALYWTIPIKHNEYNMVNEFNSKGFFFAFLYHTRDFDLASLRPEGYSQALAQEILAEYAGVDNRADNGVDNDTGNNSDDAGGGGGDAAAAVSTAGGFRPDVVFLMSEAFWDITQIPSLLFNVSDTEGFTAAAAPDPIPNYHALEKICATGEFFSNVYGGGTDTTEFNVLTGHNLANFDREIASAYKFLIRRDTDSLVRTFGRAGYTTAALHPGFEWFYNRVNVYPWLGFEKLSFISDFDAAADISGNYISDAATTDRMIGLYDAHAESGGGPFFLFTVSIQNHGPYDGGYMYGEIPKNYVTAPGISISEKGNYVLTNYIRGLTDADTALGRFVEYYEDAERPLVLVFFGDHLPAFGNNYATFHELGWPVVTDGGIDATANTYRGSYLIWANAAAREQWPEYEGMRARERRMSASYLGAYVAGQLGIGRGGYENLVNALYERLPVYHMRFYGTDDAVGAPLYDGKPALGLTVTDTGVNEAGVPENIYTTDTGNLETAKMLSDYKIAQYYKLFDERAD